MDILDIGENIDIKTFTYPINWLDSICISYEKKRILFCDCIQLFTVQLVQFMFYAEPWHRQ